MKGWSGKSKILCIEQLGRAEKKTTKQKISQSSPSLCKYFPNIFLSPGYSKIFAAVFSKSRFNWSPHFITSFIKPVRIPTDSCENYSTAEMGFQLVPIFERKWNWQNMFTQIFLSEIISTTENGGRGAHFLISQILKGSTHCAVCRSHQTILLNPEWAIKYNIWVGFWTPSRSVNNTHFHHRLLALPASLRLPHRLSTFSAGIRPYSCPIFPCRLGNYQPACWHLQPPEEHRLGLGNAG